MSKAIMLGIEKEWKLIHEETVETPWKNLIINTDDEGNTFACRELLIMASGVTDDTSGTRGFNIYLSSGENFDNDGYIATQFAFHKSGAVDIPTSFPQVRAYITLIKNNAIAITSAVENSPNNSRGNAGANLVVAFNNPAINDFCKNIKLVVAGGKTLQAGSWVKIYGR